MEDNKLISPIRLTPCNKDDKNIPLESLDVISEYTPVNASKLSIRSRFAVILAVFSFIVSVKVSYLIYDKLPIKLTASTRFVYSTP